MTTVNLIVAICWGTNLLVVVSLWRSWRSRNSGFNRLCRNLDECQREFDRAIAETEHALLSEMRCIRLEIHRGLDRLDR